jgi:hypothetical protein
VQRRRAANRRFAVSERFDAAVSQSIVVARGCQKITDVRRDTHLVERVEKIPIATANDKKMARQGPRETSWLANMTWRNERVLCISLGANQLEDAHIFPSFVLCGLLVCCMACLFAAASHPLFVGVPYFPPF